MLTMKPYLALIPFLAAIAGYAQSSLPAAQQVSDARAAANASSSKAAPRQLSTEQRAELRRQLYQYNRLHGRGS